MNGVRVCVVKVGGSLLADPGLPSRLRDWLNRETDQHGPTHFVLIVGGGALVDAVRGIDRRVALDATAAHWLCIELLNVTGQLLAARFPEATVVSEFAELEQRLRRADITVFCPHEFLRHIEPHCLGRRLACDWSVTSDSIAARLAIVLAADALVVLKSTDPPRDTGDIDPLRAAAAAGYIDAFLPLLAPELPRTEFVDFSGGPTTETVICAQSHDKNRLFAWARE